MYRNATDFYILILYSTTLLDLLVLIFFGGIFRIFLYIICHLQTVTVLPLPFQFGFLLFLFLIWLLWLGLPVLCWIKVVRVGILVLFLTLEEMLSAFHHWVWCYLWDCLYDLYYVVTFLPFPVCWDLFSQMDADFVESFLSSIEMIIWFLFFNLLMWCITLTDSWILNHPCIPWINPTWPWYMMLSIYCWI